MLRRQGRFIDHRCRRKVQSVGQIHEVSSRTSIESQFPLVSALNCVRSLMESFGGGSTQTHNTDDVPLLAMA